MLHVVQAFPMVALEIVPIWIDRIFFPGASSTGTLLVCTELSEFDRDRAELHHVGISPDEWMNLSKNSRFGRQHTCSAAACSISKFWMSVLPSSASFSPERSEKRLVTEKKRQFFFPCCVIEKWPQLFFPASSPNLRALFEQANRAPKQSGVRSLATALNQGKI